MKIKTLLPALLLAGLIAPSMITPAAAYTTYEAHKPAVVKRSNTIGSGSQVLRLMNSEDYIYVQEADEDPVDLVEQFEEYARGLGYTDCKVIYTTESTNEIMYSKVKTDKSSYDLLCTSDYMIQKLMNERNLYKFTDEDKALAPNYFGEHSKASKEIKGRLDQITTEDGQEKMADYAVGYMWGTLGILFNPEYKTFVKNGIEADEAITDMMSWDALWDSKYKNTLSIKDSVRDTYAVGILGTYKDEFIAAREKYEADRATDEVAALEEYQSTITEIFNRNDQKYIDEVAPVLKDLKNNSFGLECDSGKQDIVTGKIGVNLAWSGDAVYSMELAADEEASGGNPSELCYSIPEIGSNIWFDAWAMPNGERSQAQKELALLFLNFLCDPANVQQNVEYTGYTSFIGGDEVLELSRSWYDYRYSYVYATDDEYQVYYYDTANDEEVEVAFNDFFADPHPDATNEALYYYEGEESTEKVPLVDPNAEDEESAKELTFNDLALAIADCEIVDLSYFFGGTLSDDYDDQDMIFVSDCYLPYTYEDEDGNEVQNICVGREFFCQYPDIETINRCSVMKDYGKNNKLIVKMWENFKSDALPVWAIVLFTVEGVVLVGGVTWFLTRRQIRKNIRHKRRESEE